MFESKWNLSVVYRASFQLDKVLVFFFFLYFCWPPHTLSFYFSSEFFCCSSSSLEPTGLRCVAGMLNDDVGHRRALNTVKRNPNAVQHVRVFFIIFPVFSFPLWLSIFLYFLLSFSLSRALFIYRTRNDD